MTIPIVLISETIPYADQVAGLVLVALAAAGGAVMAVLRLLEALRWRSLMRRHPRHAERGDRHV